MRGNYLGKKDSFAFAFSTVLSLIMGWVMDRFRSSSMEQTGFLVVGTVVFFIACTDFWCLSSISEPESIPHRQKLQDAVWKPLADKEYRKVMLTYMFWNLALQIAGPFFSVYMVTGLKLDYTYITFLGLISSTVRVLAAWLWGRLADATSWLLAARCSMGMLGLVHASWLFMTPDTCYTLQPVLQALSGAAWGALPYPSLTFSIIMPLRISVCFMSAPIPPMQGFAAFFPPCLEPSFSGFFLPWKLGEFP
uniref:hypothetical protein n=1 Tax=Clostridium sp. NkU-1 TaxID=1095009 RepID=UPI000A420F8D